MVSRNVRPVAMAHTPAKNATNAILGDTRPACTSELMWVAGMNQNPPTATISSPAMMPAL